MLRTAPSLAVEYFLPGGTSRMPLRDEAQCKARFQPQRLDREAIFCALRLHVDPPDEARALEKGKDVVAIFPFVPRNKNLDVVIEAEDALEALSIA